MKQQSLKSVLYDSIWYLLVLLAVAITIVPVIWVVVSSFRPNAAIFAHTVPVSLGTFSPTPFTLEPYQEIFGKGFGRALFNTIFITACVVGGGIVVNSMAGLVYAKMDFPFKPVLFLLTLVTFMVPFRAIALPLFTIVRGLGWDNSYQALIVPALSNGVVILLFRQFFMGIPDDFIYAAKIDGGSWFTVYFRLFLPMSVASMIGGGMILFLDIWLAFLWPLIINPAQQFEVVQVSIARFATEHALIWNQQFAGTVITMLIPVFFLMILQRYFISGVTGGGIKE